MARNGRNTLNDLRTEMFIALDFIRIGKYAVVTIVKSRMFHESLKYVPGFKTNPNAKILKNISIV